MAHTLEDVKSRFRSRYLGRGGVHGLGIRRSENAVCVYLDAQERPEQPALLAEMKEEAAPFGVLVIREERSLLH